MSIFYISTPQLGYVISEGNDRIGTDKKRCKIILTGEKMGKIHTNIKITSNKCFQLVENGHPVSLNGNSIKIYGAEGYAEIELHHGDWIQIHDKNFRIFKHELEMNQTQKMNKKTL